MDHYKVQLINQAMPNTTNNAKHRECNQPTHKQRHPDDTRILPYENKE